MIYLHQSTNGHIATVWPYSQNSAALFFSCTIFQLYKVVIKPPPAPSSIQRPNIPKKKILLNYFGEYYNLKLFEQWSIDVQSLKTKDKRYMYTQAAIRIYNNNKKTVNTTHNNRVRYSRANITPQSRKWGIKALLYMYCVAHVYLIFEFWTMDLGHSRRRLSLPVSFDIIITWPSL